MEASTDNHIPTKMHFISIISTLALVGLATAAPAPNEDLVARQRCTIGSNSCPQGYFCRPDGALSVLGTCVRR